MNWILVLLLAAAMAATAYVLVRGVMTMAQGKELSSENQQQWMRRRVQFQALAIILVVILLLAAGTAGS
jgi:formate hydrogenlyase subunit 3/multisubunit Na+/H+ antiporter MnhD subunit